MNNKFRITNILMALIGASFIAPVAQAYTYEMQGLYASASSDFGTDISSTGVGITYYGKSIDTGKYPLAESDLIIRQPSINLTVGLIQMDVADVKLDGQLGGLRLNLKDRNIDVYSTINIGYSKINGGDNSFIESMTSVNRDLEIGYYLNNLTTIGLTYSLMTTEDNYSSFSADYDSSEFGVAAKKLVPLGSSMFLNLEAQLIREEFEGEFVGSNRMMAADFYFSKTFGIGAEIDFRYDRDNEALGNILTLTASKYFTSLAGAKLEYMTLTPEDGNADVTGFELTGFFRF